jgi:predicted acetyltransferase
LLPTDHDSAQGRVVALDRPIRLTAVGRAGIVASVSDFELVHPVPVEEVEPWLSNLSTALLGDPHDDDFPRRVKRWRSDWIPSRTWGARAAGRWVATLATDPRTMTVPGPDGTTNELAVDALTGVSVNATHRRRGLLTAMLTQSLAAAKERGDAVSILVAAEWPIYGRFGYAPASNDAVYSYFSRHPNGKVEPAGAGSVRQVDVAESGAVAHDVFAVARSRRAGQVDRNRLWWQRSLGLDGYERIGKTPHYYVHEGPSGPDGLLSWKVSRDFELDGRLGAAEVDDLVAATDDAYRNLWSFLSNIDVLDEIVLSGRPVDERARWLMNDGRALRQTYAGDFVWLRLLDVPAALTARAYASSDRLVLDVVDEGLGYAAGRFALDATTVGATCAATAAPPDLRLSAEALASIYLGGHSLRELALGGGVEELTHGALSRTDALFATALAPWNATGF